MTSVAIKDLTKTYPNNRVASVDMFSLDVKSGEVIALLGPSGGGKTTILKMIAGLLAPSKGDILFDGQSVLQTAPENRSAVMMFQNPMLFPHLSVAENVGFGLRMRKVPSARTTALVTQMLDLVQLQDFGKRKASDLSGGQQRRVALARALIVQPRVLLLDEPLSSLDTHLRAEMRDLLSSLHKTLKITTILVTHDQEEAVVLADRIAVILNGKLRQCDAPDAFFKRPASEAVAMFFGAQNFVPGQVKTGQFLSALGPLDLPIGLQDGPGVLTIRPEAIRLGTGKNAVTVTVLARLFMGTQTRLDLRVGAIRLVAQLPPEAVENIVPGQSITVLLPQQNLWVL